MKTFKPETDLERLLFTTVKIIVEKKNGKKMTGTGFFYEHKIESGKLKDKFAMFLITNRHVIEEVKIINLEFKGTLEKETALLNTTFTYQLDIPWFIHPNKKIDLAIVPFNVALNLMIKANQRPYIQPIVDKITYTSEKNDLINIIEDVLFIGYPRGLFDRENNIPIIRKGITATPIIFDYNNLPIFLIDASVYPGSSGSPVFICDSGSYCVKDKLYTGSRTLFLGILSSTYKNQGGIFVINSEFNKTDSELSKPYLDLGVVIKPRAILELIKIYLKQHKMIN